MNPKCWLIIFLFGLTQQLAAQTFGGFPPSTKWKQIDSDTVRIIYTAGAEEEANRIATIIHKTAAEQPTALGDKLRKINILLQSHTTQANGYVALGPWRSEFYLVPGSNIFDFGNLPWHENLAIHEYRHVQQYNNFNNGLTKVFFVLFGEQGRAFSNAITVPDWFFEGDAVHSETALTQGGRGRQAYFLSGYNSLWLEGKNYSWQKLRNGSLKDYVPNHYQLGYLMTNYGYLKYGNDFWKKVTQDASRYKGFFYPLQKAVKRHAGVDYKTFRDQAFDFYKQKLGTAKDSSVTKNRTVTDYLFPQFISKDSLVYLKKAYNKIPGFYISDATGEHRITLQDISFEDWFSYRNRKIVYTAYSTRRRWALVDYSDIVLLDIDTKISKRITSKARYYTPDLSPSGDKIVAVKINDSLQSEIHVLDNGGGVLQTISRPGEFYVNPRFVDENRIVVGIRTNDTRMSLQLLDLNLKSFEQLIPSSFNTIGQSYVNNNTVYFTGNFNGNDDIYAVRLKDKKIFQLTNGFTGNYFPCASEDELVWSHFTTGGMELRRQQLNTMAWAETSALAVTEQAALFPVALTNKLNEVKTERYASKRYKKATRLFNFHSWAPSYDDPEFTFSLYSDNILNTFSNQLFYRYNQNENSSSVGWNTSYGGFFPKLNVGLEYIFNRTITTPTRTVKYDQYEIRGGFNLPLNFTKGKMYKLFNFGSDLVYSHSKVVGKFKDSLRFTDPDAVYQSHYLTWAHYLPMARQHIYPKFGYTATLNYRSRFDDKGSQFFMSEQVFLPSIRNHSIVLQHSWQETDTSFFFSNRFAYARGYTEYIFSRMWKLGANYHFPIIYPDLGFASIVYFQRLRGNIFYDYMRVYSNDKSLYRNLRSVGAELYFDTRWWNQQPVSFGIRLSHLLDDGFNNADRRGSNWFEFILPLDLIPN